MTSSKPSRTKQTPAKPASTSSAFEQAMQDLRQPSTAFPNVSLRWLLSAIGLVLLGAIACAWLALCLLYWQGSWQLLYHPAANITRTPASVNLPFQQVHFAATETGRTQLTGWWIPSTSSRYTVLYLHGADGNLSDTVDTIASLHRNQLAVFAIDYRGYGTSQPARPNEKQLRQDTEWALTWLTLTRSIPAKSIVVYGSHLGANLAAELAADHSELAGAILDQPLQNALAPVLNDSRSRLVPAHWLMKDHYDLNGAAKALKLPLLWLFAQSPTEPSQLPDAYRAAASSKTAVTLRSPIQSDPNYQIELKRWLDDIH